MPPGFLPSDAESLTGVLGRHGMGLVGGFVPLVLHDREQRAVALDRARATAELFAAAGATRFVTAAAQDDAWSRPVPLCHRVQHRSRSGEKLLPVQSADWDLALCGYLGEQVQKAGLSDAARSVHVADRQPSAVQEGTEVLDGAVAADQDAAAAARQDVADSTDVSAADRPRALCRGHDVMLVGVPAHAANT